jgi:hypothetical protein
MLTGIKWVLAGINGCCLRSASPPTAELPWGTSGDLVLNGGYRCRWTVGRASHRPDLTNRADPPRRGDGYSIDAS